MHCDKDYLIVADNLCPLVTRTTRVEPIDCVCDDCGNVKRQSQKKRIKINSPKIIWAWILIEMPQVVTLIQSSWCVNYVAVCWCWISVVIFCSRIWDGLRSKVIRTYIVTIYTTCCLYGRPCAAINWNIYERNSCVMYGINNVWPILERGCH